MYWMNLTKGEPLRIARFGYPIFTWARPADNGTGYVWHSSGFKLFENYLPYLPEIEWVHDLDPSNTTLPVLQTLHNGNADIELEHYGYNYPRSKIIDYSYPHISDGSGVYLFSNARRVVNSRVVDGVFDSISYYLIFALVLCFILISWLSKRYQPKMPYEQCIWNITFHFSGS